MAESWETIADLKSAFAAARVSISADQLERWRGKGLLPKVRQVGRGRATGGSEIRYPAGTARQALAIARHLARKRKLDRIGWELWIEGFQVDEAHWRAPLGNARKQFSSVREAVQRAVARDENNEEAEQTVFDQSDIEVLRGTPIYAAVSRLSTDMRASVARIAAEVLLGRGAGTDAKELDSVKSVLGIAAQVPVIGGHRLNFSQIDRVLENLSAALNALDESAKLREPSIEVRRELANAQTIAVGLYRSTHWLINGALNLRTAERIFNNASIDIQAVMLLIWVQYRAIDSEIVSADTIAKMVEGAGQLIEISEKLQLANFTLPIGDSMRQKITFRHLLRKQKS